MNLKALNGEIVLVSQEEEAPLLFYPSLLWYTKSFHFAIELPVSKNALEKTKTARKHTVTKLPGMASSQCMHTVISPGQRTAVLPLLGLLA